MTRDDAAATAIDDALSEYLRSKAVGDPEGAEPGAYVSNARSAIGRWRDWLRREEGIGRVEAVEPVHMRRYARSLKTAVRRGEYEASTANTYYSYVRAFLTWCSRDQLVASNPAEDDLAVEELPDDPGTQNRQFWTPGKRRELESHVRRRALDAYETGEGDLRMRLRDHALVAVLAHTGVRGAEVFRHPKDERRNGARWADVDFEEGTLRVLGKSQEYEHAPLPEAAREPLRRYREKLAPPTPRFPLFPTGHAPSKYAAVRDQLAARGVGSATVERLLDERDVDAVVREREVVLPAISTEGARSVMKRLCADADLTIDGEYLKPHGARRGLGDELYRQSPTAAQKALRHSSPAVTDESYSHIKAGETADTIQELRDEE